MPLSPSRTTGWSSAISSRISPSPTPASRHGDRGAAARLGLDGQRAVDRPDALAHAEQPEPAVVVALGVAVDGEPHAVVAHVERHDIVHVGEREPDPLGGGVLGHVRERLLRRPQQRDLDIRGQRARLPLS